MKSCIDFKRVWFTEMIDHFLQVGVWVAKIAQHRVERRRLQEIARERDGTVGTVFMSSGVLGSTE